MAGNYFNSHPREGGDNDDYDLYEGQTISILTPVKGVTTESVPGTAVVYISILTPMKGVTPWSWPHLPLSLFQFSPPRGG